jgi:hypothetical protein
VASISSCFHAGLRLVYSSTLKMEATCYFETSANFQRATRNYNPVDKTLCEQSVSTGIINVMFSGFEVRTREADWSLELIYM